MALGGADNLARSPELRTKLLWTLGLLCAYRIGVHIPVPGVDGGALAHFFESVAGTLFGLFDMFSGGGLRNVSVFALGIMPYISASIILQLLQVVSPELKRMAKEEGAAGRRKITQYTRYSTVLITIIQGFGIAVGLETMYSPGGVPVVLEPGWTFRIMTMLTLTAGTVLIMWLGGNMVLNSGLQVGQLTGFLSYVLQVMNSMMLISNVFLLLTRSLASARRISEVLDENIVLDSPEDAVEEVPDGSVEFEGVSFKYHSGAREYALSGVELHIPAGQTVGILGGTGSAKTTLVQLIPRLYDATEGTVRVGGRDVREYDLRALRDAVGIVLQKNVLFSGTVRENLRWGKPDASDEELWAACRAACAAEFLERMPKGLDTDLGQGGVNVSGGQKQRLCIARTLLKRPKILIFDDSTSAVDTATEGKIRTALAELRDVTKLIIAQRITSVMHTDQIVILEDGRVHAVGTHESLLAGDPIYQEIYASQMKGGEDHGVPATEC